MPVRIITADERLSAAANKTSLAIFGPPGSGKTSLLKTLPAADTVCLDLEAGMKSVQDWPGGSIPVRSFSDFRDLAVLIGGPDPAADPNAWYSAQHHQHARSVYAGTGVEEYLASKSIVFVDSITDLTRQAMAYAKQQPEAFSERTGKPDVRGAYGLLGREVIQALKHLQHAAGKTVIFVGVLEKVTDESHAVSWQPQMEGSKAGRELPGIVDQVISMHLFSRDAEGALVLDERATERRLVCRAGNPFGLPAKDRSGRLDMTEAPDLGALLAKINRTAPPSWPASGSAAAAMRGESVAADPVKARARKAPAASLQAPAWNASPPSSDKPWSAQPTPAAPAAAPVSAPSASTPVPSGPSWLNG